MTCDVMPEDTAARLAGDDPADGSTRPERGFLMAAEGMRHVWDTPEEDKARHICKNPSRPPNQPRPLEAIARP